MTKIHELQNIKVTNITRQDISRQTQSAKKHDIKSFSKVMRDTVKQQKNDDEQCAFENMVFPKDLSGIPAIESLEQLITNAFIPELTEAGAFTNKVIASRLLNSFISKASPKLNEKSDVHLSQHSLDGKETSSYFQNSLGEKISTPSVKNSLSDNVPAQDLQKDVISEKPAGQIHITVEKDITEGNLQKPPESASTVTVIKGRLNGFEQRDLHSTTTTPQQESNEQSNFGGTQANLKTTVLKPVETNKMPSEIEFAEASKNAVPESENESAQFVNAIATQMSDADKVNIKVGEGLNIHDADFAKTVAEKIIFKQSEGINQFDIELNPKELGKISISIVFREGESIVSIACGKPETQALLDGHIQSIREIIELNTGSSTTVYTNQDKSGLTQQENSDGQNRQNRRQRQNDRPKKDETDTFIHRLKLGIADSGKEQEIWL